MVRAFGWLICMAAPLALAQTPARIEGTVTNSVTGAGVRKAQVFAEGLNVVTDATGHFAFENVAPGRYDLHTYAPGYSVMAPNVSGKSFSIAAEQQIKDIVIKVIPLSVIAGKVLDENGDPMARVQITVWRSAYLFGRRRLEQAGFKMTDDRGQFRIFDLEPGKYFLQASTLMMMPAVFARQENRIYPTTFYPNGLDITQAAVQEVKPGEELNGLEFHLKKSLAFHVRGTIVAREGGTQLLIYRAGQMVPIGRTIRPDGSLNIPSIPPGEYTLIAYQNNGKSMEAARTILVVSDHDVDDLKLTLEPALKLRGTSNVEGATSKLVPNGIQLLLQPPLDTSGGLPGSSASIAMNEDGTFEFSGLLPSVFSFQIHYALRDRYVKSIQLDGNEISGDILDLTNSRGGELHMVFGTDGGTIQGATAPSTMVTAVPLIDAPLRRDQLGFTISDPNGTFQFQNLAPGRYQVTAWDMDDVGEMQNLAVRKELSTRASTVTLGPNGNESVHVAAIPADEIAAALQKLP